MSATASLRLPKGATLAIAGLGPSDHMAGRMRRREFIALLGGAAVFWASAVRAQQHSRKVYRLGVLTAGTDTLIPQPAFADALRSFGWIEGKNIIFERRYAENRLDRLPELAAELVRLNVDVIIADGTLAPLAAKRATTTIPIVMSAAGDPLGSGLVFSLARPGGNLTGISLMIPDIGGKRLELLKQLLPHLSRVAILWNAANPYSELVFTATQKVAERLHIQVYSIQVRSPDDFAGAFASLTQQQLDGLITVEDPLTGSHHKQIADFAAEHRLPAMYGFWAVVSTGGLMSYGASLAHLAQQTAVYVDKILRGAKPADLPVQQPTTFELVINMKTAKALGLTIPPSLLARVDEVIE
jgi:putative tryptophan/tyrosine transport system substrate-binding protein